MLFPSEIVTGTQSRSSSQRKNPSIPNSPYLVFYHSIENVIHRPLIISKSLFFKEFWSLFTTFSPPRLCLTLSLIHLSHQRKILSHSITSLIRIQHQILVLTSYGISQTNGWDRNYIPKMGKRALYYNNEMQKEFWTVHLRYGKEKPDVRFLHMEAAIHIFAIRNFDSASTIRTVVYCRRICEKQWSIRSKGFSNTLETTVFYEKSR